MPHPLEKSTTKFNGMAMEFTNLHNVRFYDIKPREIQRMAACKTAPKLALSRSDGSIEIWDVEHAPVLEKVITQFEGNSVEQLTWANDRLFSVSLEGNVVEWDLQKLQYMRTRSVTGNALWCIASNQSATELAVGTEEGYINVLDIDNNELQYKSLFDKQAGRVLCCCYDESGEYLVTGSSNTIRIWQVATGHAIHKMQLAPEKPGSDLIVFCVKVLSDFTILAGDSNGQLTVWEGKTGAQLESYQVLKCAVLSLCIDDTQKNLVIAGVDPVMRIYTRTDIKREDSVITRWIKSLRRNVHDHDVKALTTSRGRIFSGGIDGYLGMSYWDRSQSTIVKYGPFLLGSVLSVTQQHRLALLRYQQHIDIWRLGAVLNTPDENAQKSNTFEQNNHMPNKKTQKQTKDTSSITLHKADILEINSRPQHLIQVRSKNNLHIVCAGISMDGRWLCYSNSKSLRLFRFQSNPVELEIIKVLPASIEVATHIQFSADSKCLFLLNANTAELNILSLRFEEEGEEECIEVLHCLDLKTHIKERIKFFNLSQCGNYFAVGGVAHAIGLWKANKNDTSFQHYLDLPRYSVAVITAMNLQQTKEGSRLLVCFSDSKFFEYDLEHMCFTCAAYLSDLVPDVKYHPVLSVLLEEQHSNFFLLQNDQHFIVVKKSSNQTQKPEANGLSIEANKRSRYENDARDNLGEKQLVGLKLHLQYPYEHFIQLARLNNEELVGLGVNSVALIEYLPPAFEQKKFANS